MYVEKGVFESTIGLLLDIPSKTKDGLNTRNDLQALEIREELHPPASYTLTTEEKRTICMCCTGSVSPQDSQQT
jgi:hypothetical protein